MAAVIAIAALWLLALSWRRRSVLAGLCAVAGIGCVVLSGGSGLTTSAGHARLAIALVSLLVGCVLQSVGRAIWELLDDEPRATRDCQFFRVS